MALPLSPRQGSNSFSASAVGLALMLALSACSSAPNPETKAAAVTAAVPKIITQAEHIAPPPAAPVDIEEAAPVVVVRNDPEISILDGLTSEKVHSLLGVPVFTRTDDPAEIWQYQAKSCTLDLFMYETRDDFIRRVEHFEARIKQGRTITEKDCFVTLIKAAEAMENSS